VGPVLGGLDLRFDAAMGFEQIEQIGACDHFDLLVGREVEDAGP
jgi:hypothetical protein